MPDYELAPEAKQDLLDIGLYGFENFGLEQSERYRTALEARFQELADYPLRFAAVTHIRQGYRRSVCGSHSIYYRVEEQRVAIMRILGRQDVTTALK